VKERDFIRCPNCRGIIPLDSESCAQCGFPLVGDIEPFSKDAKKRKRRLRTVLKLLGLIFVFALGITQAFYFLYKQHSDKYFGFTTEVADTIAPLSEDDAAWLEISGSDIFHERTLLTLGLLKERSPKYYDFVSDRITSVTEIAGGKTLEVDGQRLHLSGIGAMVDSLSGRMWIKTRMMFGSDALKPWDWSMYNYAATLIHEASHVEIRRQEVELETVAEEVACEEAALDFLIRASGPGVLIDSKQTYVNYPESPRYQKWYNWYHQFTKGGTT